MLKNVHEIPNINLYNFNIYEWMYCDWGRGSFCSGGDISGEIKSSYNTSIYHLYKASLTSLKADGLKICSVKNTKRDADIEASFTDDTKIKIHIYYNKEGLATLGVRVGLIGDEHKSRQLLVQIERYI